MPWDPRAYDTYTVIPFSLGSVGTYRLIGINSNMQEPLSELCMGVREDSHVNRIACSVHGLSKISAYSYQSVTYYPSHQLSLGILVGTLRLAQLLASQHVQWYHP
jgi:hypothetical protein